MSFKCQICTTTFTRLHDLNRHVKNIHPIDYHPNEFGCDFCQKSYQIKGSLAMHVKRKHPKILNVRRGVESTKQFWKEKVACDYCFKNICRKNMKIHIQRMHQRANLYATQKAYANQHVNQQ